MVYDIDKTGKRYLKLAIQCKTSYLWVVDLVFLLMMVSLVTVWHASLPYLVWNDTIENS